MNNQRLTDTIVQLNKYPPERYNVLIPVTRMQVMSNMQRIIVNEVQLDTTVDAKGNGRDIYKEGSTGGFAITKVGAMKLAAAANISIVDTTTTRTDGCERCIEMVKATGKAQPCGTCPARYDVNAIVTVRVPEPSGGFRMMKFNKEIDCAEQQRSMTEAQYKRFLPHRKAIAESKALMRAIRAALGLAPTYTLAELKKPFVIAHAVPNLDAPEIREAVASNYLQSMGMLFESQAGQQRALPAAQDAPVEAAPPDDDAGFLYGDGDMPPEEPEDEQPEWGDPDGIYCADCGNEILETTARNGRVWSPDAIKGYSEKTFGRCLCTACQDKQKGRR